MFVVTDETERDCIRLQEALESTVLSYLIRIFYVLLEAL